MLNDVFLAPFLGDDENRHVVGGLEVPLHAHGLG